MINSISKGKLKLLKGIRYLKKGKKVNTVDIFYRYGYENAVSNSDLLVLVPKRHHERVLAILNEIVVMGDLKRNGKEFVLYPDINVKFVKFHIVLSEKNFPGLIKDSRIQHVLLLKYMREVSPNCKIRSWRMVIITDKAQIFHNFPALRNDCDGPFCMEHVAAFEESVVWDLPERKYPSDKKDCDRSEIYYPGLPNENYEYHPMVNDDKSFKNIYGNGGFAKYSYVYEGERKELISRFYVPIRKASANPFSFMGGFTNDYKATTIGSYQNALQTGVRIGFFVSTDGGREWYCKYEFGDYCSYEFVQEECGFEVNNVGNRIRLSEDFVGDKVKVCRRKISKDAEGRLMISWEKPITTFCSKKDSNVVFVTEVPHEFKHNEAVAFISTDEDENKSAWFISDCSFVASKMKVFKIRVVDEKTFILYEFVANPQNSICCRHIHHINRVKDGWIVGTGEIYPNSWLVYFQDKEGDYFVKDFDVSKKVLFPKILNDCEKSVQRTIGLIWKDDKEGKVIFALDHSSLYRPIVLESNISRSSNGVYIGKIEDINDLGKFECIYETAEEGYFFDVINGIMVFGGQLGEVAISKDCGKSWRRFGLSETMIHYNGECFCGFVIEGHIFCIK